MIEKKRELRSSDESIAMKILIATNSYPTEKNPTHHFYVKNIYDGLKKEGVDVDLIHNHYFDYFKSDVESGNLFTSILKTLFIFAGFLPKILFREKEYDIIYSHAPVWPGFIMLLAQKMYGIKHVVYVHGSAAHYKNKNPILYRIASFTLKKCDLIVTNGSYVAENLREKYNCKSTIITPGYNDSVFRYKKKERNIDLLFAGNATKQKGIGLLLESIVKYKNFYKQKKLTIKVHFSGGLKEALINFAQKKGISDLIEFGDRLLEDKLAEAFHNAKVVVLPSTKESLGLVGIEAIACGAVLVGSDSGGIKEYLIDGNNGFLFKDGDVDDLQHAIEKALARFPEFEKRQPGISASVENLSLPAAMDRTLSLFRQILEKQYE